MSSPRACRLCFIISGDESLREAIRHGLLHSYERDGLEQLLLHAGALPIRIMPLLDGQLLMAVALKGKSAG